MCVAAVVHFCIVLWYEKEAHNVSLTSFSGLTYFFMYD